MFPFTANEQAKGKQKVYCSKQCYHRYSSLMYYRRRHTGEEARHCLKCGKLLKYGARLYCHKCQKEERNLYNYNKLRFAIIKQAKEDGALERFMKTRQFYQLYPELTPDQLKTKGETR